jgi:hypothetical protein
MDPALDPASSINKQKNEEKSRFLLFCDFFMTFYLKEMITLEKTYP